MITIKDITIKNFMSIGNVTQAVRFSDNGLTLVLGNNMDLGGDGSRNGTGKTTIVNALSYAMYGNALTNIKKSFSSISFFIIFIIAPTKSILSTV